MQHVRITTPGATAFTRMSRGERSIAMARVSPTTAVFDADVMGHLRGAGKDREAMLTMRPAVPHPPRAFLGDDEGPDRVDVESLAEISSVRSSKRCVLVIAALLTMTSRGA